MKFSEAIAHLVVALRDPVSGFIEIAGCSAKGRANLRLGMSQKGAETMGTATKVGHRFRCRSLIAFEQINTLVIVVELSQSSWLVAGVVPGTERRPLKKLDPDPTALLQLVEGWRDRATKAGREMTRTVLAFESGRDGFWLARWLRVRGVETSVMHSTSDAVSREPRRAKTDRLDPANEVSRDGLQSRWGRSSF